MMKFRRQSNRSNNKVAELTMLSANEFGRPLLVIVVLLVALLVSCVSIVYQAYEYRQLFNTQQQLVSHWDELQVEWGQLLLEQSALGANSKVEKKAKELLSMRVPEPESVEMISYE